MLRLPIDFGIVNVLEQGKLFERELFSRSPIPAGSVALADRARGTTSWLASACSKDRLFVVPVRPCWQSITIASKLGVAAAAIASATTGDPDITQPATTGERRLANALSHRAVGIATGVRQFLPGLLIHAAASGDHVRSSNFGEFVQWNPAIDALYW